MHNLRLQLIAAGVFVWFGASVALACGISFPWQLLNNRAETLAWMPVNNSFASEAIHVAAPPKDNLSTVELQSWSDTDSHNQALAEEVAQAEEGSLPPDQLAVVQQMRAESSGDEAFKKGALLPASIRLYTAGAVDFHNEKQAQAIARFKAVLHLPADARRDRAVWAAFMLGRLYGHAGNMSAASKAFALTRALALKGTPDPLGLAVASYGEEARFHLARAQSCETDKKMSQKQWQRCGREFAAAVTLYAEQAVRGSTSGVGSLRDVAGDLFSDPDALAASISDPMVQRLLIAYAITNLPSDNSSLASRVVSATEKRGLRNLPEADKLAALAYGSGDYHLAERVVEQATGPLAAWVKARLAMQKGNVAEGAKFYAEASKQFAPSGNASPSTEGFQALLIGQSSVLTLSRGEYLDALEQLYPYSATYWGDVAYIAERVLTIDELKTFVDTHANTELKPAVTPDPNDTEEQLGWFFREDDGPAHRLRSLLGRRLVRAGRYQEALNYLPDESRRYVRGIRDEVANYAEALNEAQNARSQVDRARAWYTAAALAGDYYSGMEIMGYEGAPDYYTRGAGQSVLRADDPFVTAGERARFMASAATPNFKGYFRFIAVEEAIHASNLLPPRSQAFAAVLCKATGWMIDGGSCAVSATTLRASSTILQSAMPGAGNKRTHRHNRGALRGVRGELTCQLYQRYLKEGSVVPWAKHFGRHCPDPDFDGAAHFTQIQELRKARRDSRILHHRWMLALGVALSVAIIFAPGTLMWLLRRRSASSS